MKLTKKIIAVGMAAVLGCAAFAAEAAAADTAVPAAETAADQTASDEELLLPEEEGVDAESAATEAAAE